MAPCTKILCSVLLVALILALVCNVKATRESGFFNKDPAYTNNPNAAGYMDSKEYFPTTTYNSYNGQGSREWQDNNGGFGEGVNGYGKGGEYATDNGAGAGASAGYGGEGSAKYGSGEWHGTNGGGYGQGGQYGSGYGGGSGSNGAYGSGYNTDFGNGNGYGGGSGNGNGEYVGNNGYNQQNP